MDQKKYYAMFHLFSKKCLEKEESLLTRDDVQSIVKAIKERYPNITDHLYQCYPILTNNNSQEMYIEYHSVGLGVMGYTEADAFVKTIETESIEFESDGVSYTTKLYPHLKSLHDPVRKVNKPLDDEIEYMSVFLRNLQKHNLVERLMFYCALREITKNRIDYVVVHDQVKDDASEILAEIAISKSDIHWFIETFDHGTFDVEDTSIRDIKVRIEP